MTALLSQLRRAASQRSVCSGIGKKLYVVTGEPSLPLEIEMVVVSASRIEHRAAAWALVGTFQILADSQLYSACTTQDCRLIPFRLWPDFDRMAGECVMADLARIVVATALHLDRDDVHWFVVMSAAGLSVKIGSVHLGPGTWHIY
jgi:hypothetical protein